MPDPKYYATCVKQMMDAQDKYDAADNNLHVRDHNTVAILYRAGINLEERKEKVRKLTADMLQEKMINEFT